MLGQDGADVEIELGDHTREALEDFAYPLQIVAQHADVSLIFPPPNTGRQPAFKPMLVRLEGFLDAGM